MSDNKVIEMIEAQLAEIKEQLRTLSEKAESNSVKFAKIEMLLTNEREDYEDLKKALESLKKGTVTKKEFDEAMKWLTLFKRVMLTGAGLTAASGGGVAIFWEKVKKIVGVE